MASQRLAANGFAVLATILLMLGAVALLWPAHKEQASGHGSEALTLDAALRARREGRGQMLQLHFNLYVHMRSLPQGGGMCWLPRCLPRATGLPTLTQ